MSSVVAPNTAPIDVSFERSIYIGNFFRGILYGLEIFTFFAAVYCLWGRSSRETRGRKFYVVYGGILLSLVTIAVTTDALAGQRMWIDHRNFVGGPGGPLGYFGSTSASWVNVFGSSADAVANIMGDGLLVYRAYMIWNSQLWVVAFPILMYIGSSVMVILTVVQSALPNAFLFDGHTAQLGVPWVSLSVSVNIVVTILICGRLLYMRRAMHAARAPELAEMYTSIIAILIESAMPFSVIGIGLIVTYAKNDEFDIAFAFVWGMFCSLSPQMIILRVAMGRGWTRDTGAQFSESLVFATGPAPVGAEKSGSSSDDTDVDERRRTNVLGASAFSTDRSVSFLGKKATDSGDMNV